MTMTAEQFHKRIWEILDPVDTAYFEVVAAPAPDAAAIASLEAAVGFPLPAALAALPPPPHRLCQLARGATRSRPQPHGDRTARL
ncbi:hypothetical protein [Achromobacter ruhlandii]|uniref:hypothetical protein n=1 Tax=Achromobacter ruhlandii TaxID=72557 RepID=UPI0020169602|nr:hypothetical protein [Achromobacter ruhlandii]